MIERTMNLEGPRVQSFLHHSFPFLQRDQQKNAEATCAASANDFARKCAHDVCQTSLVGRNRQPLPLRSGLELLLGDIHASNRKFVCITCQLKRGEGNGGMTFSHTKETADTDDDSRSFSVSIKKHVIDLADNLASCVADFRSMSLLMR